MCVCLCVRIKRQQIIITTVCVISVMFVYFILSEIYTIYGILLIVTSHFESVCVLRQKKKVEE